MSCWVHTILRCETVVQLKLFAHIGASVNVIISEPVQCSVRFFIAELHSAEHSFKSVRGDYQREIRSYFRLIFACILVAVGTSFYVYRYLCLFFLIWCKCSFRPLVISVVDVCISINWCFSLHPFPLLMLCDRVQSVREEVMVHNDFYIGSYSLLHYMFISQVIIGTVTAS